MVTLLEFIAAKLEKKIDAWSSSFFVTKSTVCVMSEVGKESVALCLHHWCTGGSKFRSPIYHYMMIVECQETVMKAAVWQI